MTRRSNGPTPTPQPTPDTAAVLTPQQLFEASIELLGVDDVSLPCRYWLNDQIETEEGIDYETMFDHPAGSLV